MRLKEQEIAKIRDIIVKYFGKSQIYIFGSRLKENVQGGDIDIFVIPKERKNLLTKSSKAKFFLENILLKPIDILVHQDFSQEIEQIAIQGIKI